MDVAVLFSGGKDSCLALLRAQRAGHNVVCLISIISKNKESYMFHTPAIEWTSMQAEAMDIPILQVESAGEKETELEDLQNALIQAKEDVHIAGVVTGAVGSVYQATRIQTICKALDLWCFNPLWQMNQLQLLRELIDEEFDVRIVGVFAYPFDQEWLGKKIDEFCIKELEALQEKLKVNPAGEGGELETMVVDAPFFSDRIEFIKTTIEYENHSGRLLIEEAELISK